MEEAVQGAVDEVVTLTDHTFVWREHWYPVGIEGYLHKDTPQAITLLNIDLVVWWGEDDMWHAAADKCPHKLAPMSEGRMDNGVLECRYHGWQFSSEGSCIANPQSGRPAKACLDMYPTQLKHGLVWVWPQRGADAFLRSSQQEVAKLPDDQMNFSTENAVYSLNPISWALLLENSMDPSHAASLHEGPLGLRTDMVPMTMKVKEIHPTRGFSMTHDGYTGAQRKMGMKATRAFVPPHTVRVEYKAGDGKTSLMDTTILIVPEKPGSAHTFGLFKFGAPPAPPEAPSLPQRLKQGLPKVMMAALVGFFKLLGVPRLALLHVFGGFKVANQDAIMLHRIDRLLVKEGGKMDWGQYKLPTQSDAGAAAFWRWVSKFGGGDADWEGNTSAAELPPKFPREELFNQWDRHSKHCPDCKKGAEALEATLKRLKVIGGLLCMAAVLVTNRFGPRLALVAAAGAVYLLYQKLDALHKSFYHMTLPVDGKRPAPQT